MSESLFSNIYKYRQSKVKSALENYCTEIFVYIFRQLLYSKSDISYELLKIFGYNNIKEKDLKYFEIITQESHISNKKRVIPDIIIKFNDIINIIEVKIGSGLNYYEIDDKFIDQIELYKNIKDIKINDVYLLSKDVILCNSIKNTNNILWSQIYSLLSKSDNEVINNFNLLLEEYGMKSYILKNGAENTIDSIAAIMNLIEKSWEYNDKYPLKEEISRGWIGFWVKNKDTAWIGQLIEKKEYLVFEIFDKKLIKKAENIFKENNINTELDSSDNIIFSKLKLKDIISYKTEKEQIEIIKKWCNDIIKKILL